MNRNEVEIYKVTGKKSAKIGQNQHFFDPCVRDALQFASQKTFISTHPFHFGENKLNFICAQRDQSALARARHFLSERFDPSFYKGKTRFLRGVSSTQLKSKNGFG